MKERIKFTYSEILIMLAIAIALFTVTWAIAYYCFPIKEAVNVSHHIASPETINLMKKHGPNYLYEIDKGIIYLHRDGQRIEVGRVR